MTTLLHHRRSLLLILAFVCTYTLASAQCDVLVWSDEFEGTGFPNDAYWNYDLGAGGWGNNEVQNYRKHLDNVHLEDGKLIIEARKSGGSWTSARVKSQSKKTFTYGKVVFRAKLPTGVGTWPALWMLGQNITSIGWPKCGEMDVMEHVGRDLNRVQSALHTPNNNGGGAIVAARTVSTATTEFHEYAVSWNADRVAFYIDNVLYHTYNPASKNDNNYPFNWDFFMIMNIAMGGNLGGPIAADLTYAKMEVDYVRVYEERTEPAIQGPQFVYENETNLQFTAPEYEDGVTYTWTAPAGAEIISGQGTNEITVDWGSADGTLELDLSGNTGCTNNSTQINVSTIVEPTGARYLVHSFAANSISGWTKTGTTDVTMQASGERLNVTYNSTAVRYIQYELPKAVDIQDYSIIKIPITIPTTSASVPELILKLRDGNGNETNVSRYELGITDKDGANRFYGKNFNQWTLEDPEVDPNRMKYIRIYILPGQGTFSLGDVYFYNNQTIPETPTNLTADISGNQITLAWEDLSNATSFHVYRSATETGTYTRLQSNLETSENPFVITATSGVNYYKVSGVNANGESALSASEEAIAVVTATEDPLADVSVFPNPSTGKFQITLPEQVIDRIDLYDLQGRMISYQATYQEQHILLTLDNPSKGIYFLKLIQKNKSRVYKILVE